MPTLSNQTATLTSGQETLLKRAVIRRVRVRITGIAGEFTEIPLRLRLRGGFSDSGLFLGTEATVPSFLQALPFADILATTPEGVGSLDIIFEVQTGRDSF